MKILYYHTAEWCAPCKNLKPKVRKLCEENNIVFDERDIDNHEKPPVIPDLVGVPTIAIEEVGHVGYDIIRPHEANLPTIRKVLGLV